MNVQTAPAINGLRTVAVPVTDQNRALAFYVDRLGFEIRVDAPLDEIGGRWIELAPPGSGTTIALAPVNGGSPAGVSTGIRLTTADAVRLHDELNGQRVDVDDVLSWPGVPPMFEFRDPDGNGLVIVQDASAPDAPSGPAVASAVRPTSADALPPARPEIVSAADWARARESLLVAEKEATRAQDALAARRRRLPMVQFHDDYTFTTPDGPKSLTELFEGRNQLVVYQFMDNGPDDYCPGCTWFTKNVPAAGPAALADNGITWLTVSDMPLEQIDNYKALMGWSLPFVSSRGTSFAKDCGVEGGFMLSVFLRDGADIYRTYSTTSRGVDGLVFVNKILDLTAYGRQEAWEDSPAGWPQHPTYG